MYNMVKMNKKGIEMSINIIVMLVIGLTILGLVIGFVQGMFSDLDENIGGYQSEQDLQMLDRVKSCKDNPCVLPSPTITVGVGDTKNIFIKVRSATSEGVDVSAGPLAFFNSLALTLDNTGVPQTNEYFSSGKELSFQLVDSQGAIQEGGTSATAKYNVYGSGFSVSQGEEDSQMYILDAGTLSVGTYFATLRLTENIDGINTNVEGTATLTINVE